MGTRILITGGAGFIGSHLADDLLAHGYEVRALDVLAPQVHGSLAQRDGAARRPAYLSRDVDLIVGDVCDGEAVRRALRGVDAVVHLAAAVGVGQSMYAIAHYTRTNNLGTAVLLEALIERPVARLVVASSMSIYGEGLYRRPDGRSVSVRSRDLPALQAGDWDPRDDDGAPLTPVPTPESHLSVARPESVYALSKLDQERLCLIAGRAYGIPTAALRFFNAYGSRQALGNPYTGVLAIFASRLLNARAPLINEDGLQRRDFVHVRDVASACRLALEVRADRLGADGDAVFNVASGDGRTILEIASQLATLLGRPIEPQLTGAYRVGDIRHCIADIARARAVLGFAPRVRFEDGLRELALWLAEQPRVDDGVGAARAELVARGLSLTADDHRKHDASPIGDAVPTATLDPVAR